VLAEAWAKASSGTAVATAAIAQAPKKSRRVIVRRPESCAEGRTFVFFIQFSFVRSSWR
jgi:hypothetical protein